jgi:enoyl-CoA hydratase/carnithine racemase
VLHVHDDGPVRTIALARPEKRNALDDLTRRQLQQQVDELRDRGDVRVVVLRGEGPSFSAGADLHDRPAAEPGANAPRVAARRWQRLLDDLERLPQVTVAVLHGHVVGGAALLAAACDLRVAAGDLALRIPELALGIPLTWAGLPRLAREIGVSRTRELVMTGRTVDAAEALAIGLVHRVATRDGLDAAVDDLVASLVAQPAVPLAMTVDALRALGRAVSAPELSWSDADMLRWSLRDAARGRAGDGDAH